MACLSSHRIFLRLQCRYARVYIHKRIVCHHGLVHAVESQTLSVVAPEQTFIYAELVAVDTLSVHNISRPVGRKLHCLAVLAHNKQIVVLDISERPGHCVPFFRLHSLTADIGCRHLLLLPVNQHSHVSVGEHHYVLVSIRELRAVKTAYLAVLAESFLFYHIIYIVEREQLFLAGILRIDGTALVVVVMDKSLSPPRCVPVLRRHIVIVVAAKVKILQ